MKVHPSALRVMETLESHGHQAYAVGGCVRDLVAGLIPKDWDVATDATPAEVRRIFSRTVPLGLRYGTVQVRDFGEAVEVTTFRTESGYADRRHPGRVEFVDSIDGDLARRDFTFNALALDARGTLIDPFGGVGDLEARVVRAVGDPAARFREDALRMLRAVRFAAQLGAGIEPGTLAAIKAEAPLIGEISRERIRDEMNRILVAAHPVRGLVLMEETGLLAAVLPEVAACVGVEQNRFHRYDVWRHSLQTVAHVRGDLTLRLAALFHDVGKPSSLTVAEDGHRRFYGHDCAGAEIAGNALRRLRYDAETVSRVTVLVRHHMRLHHLVGAGDAALRRLIREIGPEQVPLLVELAEADIAAKGLDNGTPAAQQEVHARLLALSRDDTQPVGLNRLAVDGTDVMRELGVGPGPVVGRALERLLETVMQDPRMNTRRRLLQALRDMARQGSL